MLTDSAIDYIIKTYNVKEENVETFKKLWATLSYRDLIKTKDVLKCIYGEDISIIDEIMAVFKELNKVICAGEPICGSNIQFCDGCEYISISEANQESLRYMKYSTIPDHQCTLLDHTQIKHLGHHPRLPKLPDCPFKDNGVGGKK